MINFGSTTGGRPAYGRKLFYLDFDSDVASLPTNCAVGSTAYVIQNSTCYIMNSNKEWIKQTCNIGGGGSTPGTGEGDVEWGDMSDTSLDDIGEIEWEPMV